jgi:DNA-binding MarR family transcriptional regulator
MDNPADEISRDCLALRIRLLNRRVTRLYDVALRDHGLRAGQLNLLVAIARGVRQAEALARLLDMDPSTLSRDLGPLKRAGWIKVAAGSDRRSKALQLTPAGEALLEEARPAWREAQRRAGELLGQEAARSLFRAAPLN